jgi:drug/metabolite transporter (DMT)-like permease
MLFLYAVPFSFAYTRLNTGTGALILFGCVQLTMMIAGLWSGERPHSLQWLGLSLAIGGLVYLVFPGLEAPSFAGAVLMALAGFSWGVYSLRGRGAANPLAQTTNSFVRTVPLVLAVSVVTLSQFHVQREGVLLAVASGSLASGLGYVVWYEALRGLTVTRAAVVQLLVPILAALGGVIFLAEAISWRLALSGVIVLGGIALALLGRERLKPRTIR